MITNKNKLIIKQDGTLICGFCLRPIKIERKVWNDGYEEESWTEYSCKCEEWKAYDQLNQDEMELNREYNKKLKQLAEEYKEDRAKLIKKANKCSPSKCVESDFRAYIWDVNPPINLTESTDNDWTVK